MPVQVNPVDSFDLRYSATSTLIWNAGTSALTRGSFVLLPNLHRCYTQQCPSAAVPPDRKRKSNREKRDSLRRNIPLNTRLNGRIDERLMVDVERREVDDGVLTFESCDELGGRICVGDGVDGDGGGKGGL